MPYERGSLPGKEQERRGDGHKTYGVTIENLTGPSILQLFCCLTGNGDIVNSHWSKGISDAAIVAERMAIQVIIAHVPRRRQPVPASRMTATPVPATAMCLQHRNPQGAWRYYMVGATFASITKTLEAPALYELGASRLRPNGRARSRCTRERSFSSDSRHMTRGAHVSRRAHAQLIVETDFVNLSPSRALRPCLLGATIPRDARHTGPAPRAL